MHGDHAHREASPAACTHARAEMCTSRRGWRHVLHARTRCSRPARRGRRTRRAATRCLACAAGPPGRAAGAAAREHTPARRARMRDAPRFAVSGPARHPRKSVWTAGASHVCTAATCLNILLCPSIRVLDVRDAQRTLCVTHAAMLRYYNSRTGTEGAHTGTRHEEHTREHQPQRHAPILAWPAGSRCPSHHAGSAAYRRNQ